MTRWSRRRGRIGIEIADGRVRAAERLFGRAREWDEPVSAYAGVQLSSNVRAGAIFGMRRWHEVVLRHHEADRTIPLYGSPRLAEARRLWKEAALALGLPALERTPAGYIARDADELDKPYRGLEGARLSGRLVGPVRAPASVVCSRRGAATRATLRPNALECIPALLLLTLGLLFLFLGSALGVGLGAAGALLLATGRCARRGIELTPDEVACSWMTPIGDFRRRAIPLRELHTVAWTGREAPRRGEGALLLASDVAEIALDGLPRRQADCLGRLVLNAALGREPRLRRPIEPLPRPVRMPEVAVRRDAVAD